MFWGKAGEFSRGSNILQLHLKYIKSLDDEMGSSMFFGKKRRLVIRLHDVQPGKLPGPLDNSSAAFIKLSGPNGIGANFAQALNETLMARVWQISDQVASPSAPPRIKQRSGIGGIEKGMLEKQKLAGESMSIAFQDLSKLMASAKEMVNLSKGISQKIRERQSEASEDETLKFKSLLMSLGIDDPVTKDNFTSNTEYLQSLGNEICQSLLDVITVSCMNYCAMTSFYNSGILQESGGMMTIAEVYCRINRARGLELVSPEDVLNACKLLNGPMKLRQYPSGAMILQLDNHSDEQVADDVEQIVKDVGSMSIEECAREKHISVLLAHERFLIAERAGRVCRDESVEGLRFFPNLFLTQQ